MYDCALARYDKLETVNKWDKKKSHEENIKLQDNGNPGRAFDETADYAKALEKHFDPVEAEKKLKETHMLLAKKNLKTTAKDREENGWAEAYDLRVWHEFPDTIRITMMSAVMQNVSRGYFGAGGGPTKESVSLGEFYREIVESA